MWADVLTQVTPAYMGVGSATTYCVPGPKSRAVTFWGSPDYMRTAFG